MKNVLIGEAATNQKIISLYQALDLFNQFGPWFKVFAGLRQFTESKFAAEMADYACNEYNKTVEPNYRFSIPTWAALGVEDAGDYYPYIEIWHSSNSARDYHFFEMPDSSFQVDYPVDSTLAYFIEQL